MWVLSIPPPSASRSGAPYVAEAAHLPLQLDGPAVWQHSGTKPVPKSRVSGSRHIPLPLADGTHTCVPSRTRRPAVDERIRVVQETEVPGAVGTGILEQLSRGMQDALEEGHHLVKRVRRLETVEYDEWRKTRAHRTWTTRRWQGCGAITTSKC